MSLKKENVIKCWKFSRLFEIFKIFFPHVPKKKEKKNLINCCKFSRFLKYIFFTCRNFQDFLNIFFSHVPHEKNNN